MKSHVKLNDKDIRKTKSRLILDNKVPNDFVSDSGDIFKWLWLSSSDIGHLLDLRNAEHVRKNMRNTSPISEQMHLDFLKKYHSLQRIDFILYHQESGEYIGGINIALTSYGFEIGKYISNIRYLGKGLAFPMTKNFLDYVKKNVKEIENIYAVTKLDNYKNINLNFKLGFKIVKLVEEKYWLMKVI